MMKISEFQDTLANHVIANSTFRFNSRPSPYVKHGSMYVLQKSNYHVYNGLAVENFTFFGKEFGEQQLDRPIKVFLKGYADVSSDNVKDALRKKIKSALKEDVGKDFFTDDCDVVLRLNGLSTCSGGAGNNPHRKCVEAKTNFEQKEQVEICSQNIRASRKSADIIPCLYENLIHSHKDFRSLKLLYNSESGRYCVCTQTDGGFIIKQKPKTGVDDTIYSAYTKTLEGILQVKLIGIYLRDDKTLSDTMKIWCNIVESNLLTTFSEKAETLIHLGEDETEMEEENTPCVEERRRREEDVN